MRRVRQEVPAMSTSVSGREEKNTVSVKISVLGSTRTWFAGALLGLALLPLAGVFLKDSASALELKLRITDHPNIRNATLRPAARAMLTHGPLPFSSADVAAKAAADRAYQKAVRSGRLGPLGEAEPEISAAPTIAKKFAGVFDPNATPPDTTGAV